MNFTSDGAYLKHTLILESEVALGVLVYSFKAIPRTERISHPLNTPRTE